jgi:hypothetical protein
MLAWIIGLAVVAIFFGSLTIWAFSLNDDPVRIIKQALKGDFVSVSKHEFLGISHHKKAQLPRPVGREFFIVWYADTNLMSITKRLYKALVDEDFTVSLNGCFGDATSFDATKGSQDFSSRITEGKNIANSFEILVIDQSEETVEVPFPAEA